jgi:hypothetical protein
MRFNPVPVFIGALLGTGCYLAFGSTVAGFALLGWLAFTIIVSIVF